MNYFNKGHRIPLDNGSEAIVLSTLGEGGQGVVYRVSVDKREYALKWYRKKAINNPKRFYNNLKHNIMKGAPTEAFLWPKYLTMVKEGSFGYIMELRPERFRDFSEFLLARTRFESVSAAINAALNITNGFRELHRSGFSYQDLNDGNFFIDPHTGEVLICDNDNVAPYGESLGIAGKARYMAPEVVRNMKRPDCMTDRYSLAVILFRLLFLDHPLEGKRTLCPCLTEELEHKFYGTEPIFIFDPDNDTNRPVRGVHGNVIRFWPVYPSAIRAMFIKAFSQDSLHEKVARINDSEWQDAFMALRDSTVKCPCGGDTFLDLSTAASACINCGMRIPRPPVLRVKKYSLALFPGQKLCRCHTDSESDDYAAIHGEVIRNPQRPDIWGLRNTSRSVWIATLRNGEQKPVGSGEVVVIANTKGICFTGVNSVIE